MEPRMGARKLKSLNPIDAKAGLKKTFSPMPGQTASR